MTTKSTMAASAVLVAGLSLLASGCAGGPRSAPPPPSHLAPSVGEEVLLTLRHQTAPKKKSRVMVPAHTKQLLLRADCLGGQKSSTMRIVVSSSSSGSDAFYGGGSFGCTRASGAGGRVSLGNEAAQVVADQTYAVTITAPPDSTWSAAVDVNTTSAR